MALEQAGGRFGAKEVLPAHMAASGKRGALEKAPQAVQRAFFLRPVGEGSGDAARGPAQGGGKLVQIALRLAGFEAVVTHKDLVASFAGKANRDVLAGLAADEVVGQHREFREWLVQVPDRLFDDLRGDGVDQQLAVLGGEMVGDPARVGELRETRFPVAQGEGADGAGAWRLGGR